MISTTDMIGEFSFRKVDNQLNTHSRNHLRYTTSVSKQYYAEFSFENENILTCPHGEKVRGIFCRVCQARLA